MYRKDVDTDELSNDAIDFNIFFEKHPEQHLNLEDDWQYEIESYYNEKQIGYKDDILEWWKKNSDRYPCLSRMARDFLYSCYVGSIGEIIFESDTFYS